MLGDLDEDGSITVSDLTLLVAHLQGTAILPEAFVPFADVDESGGVDAADVEALADLILAGGSEPIPLAQVTETLPQQG